MVESVHAQPRIVRAGQKAVARTQARAQHAEVLVALLLQPVNAAADIDHRLAAGGNRPANVRAHGVVGALQLRRPANVVVGLRKPQRRDAHAIEHRAQRVVAEPVGVPLRHHDDGLFGPRRIFLRRRRKPARVHQVVLRVRRALRRGKAQILGLGEFAFGGLLLQLRILCERFRPNVGRKQLRMALLQSEIRRALVAKEDVAMADQNLVDAKHCGFRSRRVADNIGIGNGVAKAVRLKKRSDPLKAPLQWAHHAIFVARG